MSKGQRRANRVNARARRRQPNQPTDPRCAGVQRWLGAGALTLGLGAAMATGTGLAHADETGTDSGNPSSSSDATGTSSDASKNDAVDNPTTGPSTTEDDTSSGEDPVAGSADPDDSTDDEHDDADDDPIDTAADIDDEDDSVADVPATPRKHSSTPTGIRSLATATKPTVDRTTADSPVLKIDTTAVNDADTSTNGPQQVSGIASDTAPATIVTARVSTPTPTALAAALVENTPAPISPLEALGAWLNQLGQILVEANRRFRYTFFNTAPTATLTVGEPDANGVFSGQVGATDPDDTLLTYTVVTPPPTGQVDLRPDGSFTYTPDPLAPITGQSATFTIKVDDAPGNPNHIHGLLDLLGLYRTPTVTVTIPTAPVDRAPTAADDTATTDEDTPKVISVLGNDTDPDGDTLTVSSVGNAGHGTVTLVGGVITYTPTANFNGTDTFTYTVTDGTLDSAATVTVTVIAVNDAPAANDDTATTIEGTPKIIEVLDNDTDADGNNPFITAVGNAAHGSVHVSGGTTIIYTPAANFVGTDTFTYTVSDGFGGTATATATVTVTLNPLKPIAGSSTASTPTTDTGVVTGTIGVTSPAEHPLTYTVIQNPGSGTLTVNADGTYVYTPSFVARIGAGGSTGSIFDTFVVGAANGHGTVTQTIKVTVGPVKGALVQSIGVGLQPGQVTVTADGTRAIVLNNVGAQGGTGSLSIVTLSTGAVTNIPIADARSMVINATGTHAYVITDGPLVAVDLATRTITNIGDGSGAQGMALSPDGTKLYISYPNEPYSLGVLNIATRVTNLMSIPASGPITTNADGSRVYVANGFVVSVKAPSGSGLGPTLTTYATPLLNPTSLTLSADGSRLYIFDATAHSVAIVDTATKLYTVTDVGSGATHFTLSADGTLGYVTNAAEGIVSVFGVAAKLTLQKIRGVDAPAAVAVSADGRTLYVTDTTTNTVAVVALAGGVTDGPVLGVPTRTGSDLITGSVTGTTGFLNGATLTYQVTTGPTQGTLTLDAVGNYTYVAYPAARRSAGPNTSDTFTVVATDAQGRTNTVTISVPVTNPVTGSTTLANFIRTQATSPNGKYTYAVQADGSIAVIDNIRRTVVGTITAPSGIQFQSVAVAPDGKAVYATRFAFDQLGNATGGAVMVIDTANPASATYNTIVATITIPGGRVQPTAVVPSLDGSRIYVLDAGNARVLAYNTTTFARLAEYSTGAFGGGRTLTVSADGARLFVIGQAPPDQRVVLSVITTATGALTTLPLTGSPNDIAVSADGNQVWMTNYDGKVSVLDLSNLANPVIQTVDVGMRPVSLVISPNGTRVFVADEGGHLEGGTPIFPIYVIDVATRTVVGELTVPYGTMPSVEARELTITADGTRLHLVGGARSISELVVSDIPLAGVPSMSVDSGSGRVIGWLGFTDPARWPLNYTVATGPARGQLTIDAQGRYTYTPTAAARHAAAQVSGAVTTDTFTITADNGQGRSTTTTVTVAILPQNTAPTTPGYGSTQPATAVAGSPTGAVAVRLFDVADGDNDAISFSGMASYGSFDGATGIYTPTLAARLAAANGGPTQDTLLLVASDGHGGVLTQTVTVPIVAGVYVSWSTIPRPGNLFGVDAVISPDGKKVYIAGTMGLAVVDVATNSYTWSTTVTSGGEGGVAISPDGKTAYVAVPGSISQLNGGLAAVNLTTGAVSFVPIGYGMWGVAVSPDGKRVWVTTPERWDGVPESNVFVVDTTDPTDLKLLGGPIRTIPNPRTVTFSPDGSLAFVLGQPVDGFSGGGVSVVRTGDMAILKTLYVTGAQDLAITPDGRTVYVAAQGGLLAGVRVIHVTADPANSYADGYVIDTDGGVGAIAVSPDGTLVYAVGISGLVSVIDSSTKTVVQQLNTIGDARAVVVTPDGSRLYVLNGSHVVAWAQMRAISTT